jgi:hypothetical protein
MSTSQQQNTIATSETREVRLLRIGALAPRVDRAVAEREDYRRWYHATLDSSRERGELLVDLVTRLRRLEWFAASLAGVDTPSRLRGVGTVERPASAKDVHTAGLESLEYLAKVLQSMSSEACAAYEALGEPQAVHEPSSTLLACDESLMTIEAAETVG